MTTIDLIKKHLTSIKILEGIQIFERRKQNKFESINGFAGTFPALRKKMLNEVDTINRCIKRLQSRYDKLNDIAKCDECNGTGEVEKTIFSGDDGMVIEMDMVVECSQCDGTGKL